MEGDDPSPLVELERSAGVRRRGAPPKGEVPAGLVPFTTDTARAAGLRSAQARRDRAAAQRVTAVEVASEVRTLATLVRRDELGPIAFAAAADLIGRIVRGDIPVRNGEEAASLLRALVEVGRMESGDAGRTVAVAHLSGPALAQRLRELQRDVPSSSAVAADDHAPPGPVIDAAGAPVPPA